MIAPHFSIGSIVCKPGVNFILAQAIIDSTLFLGAPERIGLAPGIEPAIIVTFEAISTARESHTAEAVNVEDVAVVTFAIAVVLVETVPIEPVAPEAASFGGNNQKLRR